MSGQISKLKSSLLGLSLIALGTVGMPAQALRIELNADPGIDTRALQGFREAAYMWEQLLIDDIVVRLDVGFEALPPGVLGSTGSEQVVLSYADVFGALQLDATSKEDDIAVANLRPFNDLLFITNNANGDLIINDAADNWSHFMAVNTANARALGLTIDANGDPIPAGADASITFSSEFTFDFNAHDGVDDDAFDFVGIAAHEIGHALGFVSGVDIVDITMLPNGPFAPFPLEDFAVFNTMDLFRYSALSRALCGTGPLSCLDLSVNLDPLAEAIVGGGDLVGRDISYFSIDGGNSNLAFMSGGRFNGEGAQASHWFADDFGLTPTFGIMDPTSARGQVLSISDLDVTMFDVIGWNRVPEPGTLALLGLGLVGLGVMRRRKTA